MRIRHVKNADELINNCSYLVNNPQTYKGKYQELFNNNNPIYLEIGMGKGDFIINSALSNKDINYIGIEKYDSVIAKAIVKINNYNINNLRIIRMDAKDINEVFDHEITLLHLNFSDPWPKKRHCERRLTSKTFLALYDNIFTIKKHLIFKTDNTSLFESSLVSLNNYGYHFNNISLDLHQTDIPNIETEYEKKFSDLGEKIKYIDCDKE